MPSSISVLFPIRDASETLDAALCSLWRQTWTNFEVLAVDDGSTDSGPQILRNHARREKRLRILSSGGSGLVSSLELARSAARSPFLARMDADDLCHPDRFRRQIRYLRSHPEVAAVGSKVALFPQKSLGPGWRRYQAWLNGLITPQDHARELFVESPLAHPSVLMRAAAVMEVGGYQDRGWPEDYDLWLRLDEAGHGLAKVAATLLAWRHTPWRLSVTSPRYDLRAFQAARAAYLARHPVLRDGRAAVWGAGRTGRRLSRLLTAHRIETVRFYDVDPRKIGTRVQGAPVRSWTELEAPGALPLLVAVGAPGARALIRPETRRLGYREGIDFLFAA
jgi:glycosyltransferase involved in cell wall biosynthesis